MKFVHPEILWGLGAVAIPVIVHLFNFRKFKKVLFPNVAFLQEIQQETKSKSKLKHLLILLSRMLAVACVVFAFAQPYFPVAGDITSAGTKAVSIYVDNSFSMEGDGASGELLEQAKAKAISLVDAHQGSDKFQLLTNDFEGKHQRLVSKDEMIQLIQEVKPSPAFKKWSEIISRQNDLLVKTNYNGKLAYLITDGQKNSIDPGAILLDSTVVYRAVIENGKSTSNLSIDSVWFSSPVRQINQTENLWVKLTNNGNDDKENVSINLKINGQQKSVATANVESMTSQEVALSFTNTEAGLKAAEVSIEDNPITFDNTFYFSFRVAPEIKIYEIDGKDLSENPFDILLSGDSYFSVTKTSENAIDFSQIAQNNLVILNQINSLGSGLSLELEKFISNGGSVWLIPSEDGDFTSYNQLLQSCGASLFEGKMKYGLDPGNPVHQVNFDHYLLKGVLEKNLSSNEKVDYPVVGNFFRIAYGPSEPIMTLLGGEPFITSCNHGGGRIYTSAVSLKREDSNFITHSFFPMLTLRIAEFSQNSDAMSYTLGNEQAILLRNFTVSNEETFRLSKKDIQEIIPEHRSIGGNSEIFLHGDIAAAGCYDLYLGDSLVNTIALNYSRQESKLNYSEPSVIQNELTESGIEKLNVIQADTQTMANYADELDNGKKLWLTMIVWALIFLAIEILLIKYWR